MLGQDWTLSAPSGSLVQHSLGQECIWSVCTQNTPLLVGQGRFRACLFVRGTGDYRIQSCWKLRSVRELKMNQGMFKGPEADQLRNLRSEDLGGYEQWFRRKSTEWTLDKFMMRCPFLGLLAFMGYLSDRCWHFERARNGPQRQQVGVLMGV